MVRYGTCQVFIFHHTMENIMSAPTVLSPVFERAVPVVFGADDSFFIPLVVCIQSIVENASDDECYDIVVLANKFGEKYTAILRSMAEERKNVSIRVYDVEPFLNTWDLSRLKTGHRLSLATYYRLFIPDLMKDYHKVLYIDGDTVVLDDIASLYHTDISDCYAGVVKDYNIIRDMSMSFRRHVQQLLQMEDINAYFNAGVLVLNLDLIRRDFTLPFFMEQAELKGAKHHDQDVLNSLFYGRVRYLSPKYNSMWQNRELYASVEGGDDAIRCPVIVHYPGGGKPWLKGGAFREASRHFWKYAVICPYAEEIMDACRQDCARSVAGYAQQKKRYLWYKLLSLLLFGRKRRHYAEKVQAMRRSLAETEALMKHGEDAMPWKVLSKA